MAFTAKDVMTLRIRARRYVGLQKALIDADGDMERLPSF